MSTGSDNNRARPLPEVISGEILAQIENGHWVAGDRLPTETALATQFNVSRNVIREAIARLRGDGVVDTQQGRGATVRAASKRESFRIDLAALDQAQNVDQLFELRAILEIDAAGLAARNRSPRDLGDITEAVEIMREKTNFDEECLEAGAQFHRAIGAATQNQFLRMLIDYISDRLTETTRATDARYPKDDLLKLTFEEHNDILDAIRLRDIKSARDHMRRHLRLSAERLGLSVNLDDISSQGPR